jgi:hypothetical protein
VDNEYYLINLRIWFWHLGTHFNSFPWKENSQPQEERSFVLQQKQNAYNTYFLDCWYKRYSHML